ncbi:uncharacterized protein LOC141680533 [Apium graveolens]|uniref:uncharacterized protein LOC141680533 n=1 Tax=Apium graveolens TaxID=4045 RepID=UPI003D79B9A5
MKRYYQSMLQNEIPSVQSKNVSEPSVHNRQQNCEELNVDELPIDPKKRKNISNLHVNDREKVRSQALAFRGHDESEKSNRKGNFFTFVQFLADHNEEIKMVVLDKAPDNNKLTSPDIQKDMVKAMVVETTNIILSELGDDLFSILVDESRDISIKEQMKYQLSIARIRGQGYDGLKSLILKDNPCAFYVHCFAHQLQLALVGTVKKHQKISIFFTQLNTITSVVVGACKRQHLLRDKQTSEVVEGICSGQISTRKGLNQESTLKRAGDTRWGSYYTTLLSLIRLFNPAINVFEHIVEHTDDHDLRVMDCHVLYKKKDQDIVNAINLFNVTKNMLKSMRKDGCESFLQEVTLFCESHNVVVVDMSSSFIDRRRVLRKSGVLTNLHHYRNDMFTDILEIQVQELNDRFDEIGSELLLGMSCLDPQNSFYAFDKERLVNFVKLYPSEFSPVHIMELEWALPTYFQDVTHDERFVDLDGISELAGVERAFSAMNIVMTRLLNRIGDEWLNDLLVAYIERDIFLCVKTEDVLQRFQNMKSRRGALKTGKSQPQPFGYVPGKSYPLTK